MCRGLVCRHAYMQSESDDVCWQWIDVVPAPLCRQATMTQRLWVGYNRCARAHAMVRSTEAWWVMVSPGVPCQCTIKPRSPGAFPCGVLAAPMWAWHQSNQPAILWFYMYSRFRCVIDRIEAHNRLTDTSHPAFKYGTRIPDTYLVSG